MPEMSNPIFWEKIEETICMEYQRLVSEKNISKCRLLKFVPNKLTLKIFPCHLLLFSVLGISSHNTLAV